MFSTVRNIPVFCGDDKVESKRVVAVEGK